MTPENLSGLKKNNFLTDKFIQNCFSNRFLFELTNEKRIKKKITDFRYSIVSIILNKQSISLLIKDNFLQRDAIKKQNCVIKKRQNPPCI